MPSCFSRGLKSSSGIPELPEEEKSKIIWGSTQCAHIIPYSIAPQGITELFERATDDSASNLQRLPELRMWRYLTVKSHGFTNAKPSR
ncbi:hypothetical protein DTO212C5_4443 [Paecilomyces variotii]|nr:hypothetical protein DTO212C5_4443 [Paecilomyces variotii]KAJ9347597.1 hypothetical protein DTO027B9_9042 [Paecilomyces variotii]